MNGTTSMESIDLLLELFSMRHNTRAVVLGRSPSSMS